MPWAFSFPRAPCSPVLLLGMGLGGRKVAAGCSARCCIQALLGFIKIVDKSGKQELLPQLGSSACSAAVLFVSPHRVKGKRSG